MYFMLTACGHPQGGEGALAHVDGGGWSKIQFFGDVINGWPLERLTNKPLDIKTYFIICCLRLIER